MTILSPWKREAARAQRPSVDHRTTHKEICFFSAERDGSNLSGSVHIQGQCVIDGQTYAFDEIAHPRLVPIDPPFLTRREFIEYVEGLVGRNVRLVPTVGKPVEGRLLRDDGPGRVRVFGQCCSDAYTSDTVADLQLLLPA